MVLLRKRNLLKARKISLDYHSIAVPDFIKRLSLFLYVYLTVHHRHQFLQSSSQTFCRVDRIFWVCRDPSIVISFYDEFHIWGKYIQPLHFPCVWINEKSSLFLDDIDDDVLPAF